MKRKKLDGRRHNGGSQNRGLREAKKLVTGPAALFDAMELRAAEQQIKAAEAWRRAARAWLAGGVTPEG